MSAMLVRGLERYAGYMRYAQGAGRTAEGRRRGKRIRLKAVEGFGQRMSAAVIAAELRASERSVRQCRPAANWRRQMRTVSAQTIGTRQDALDNRLRPLHPCVICTSAFRRPSSGPDRLKQEFWASAVAVRQATTGRIRRPKGSRSH
jgi:hypothetical protein